MQTEMCCTGDCVGVHELPQRATMADCWLITTLRFPAPERGQYRVHLAWLHVAAALALHQSFKAPYVLRLASRAVECQERSSQ